LAISSSEQRFRYIPLQRIPGIPGVNEAVPRPICYVTTPAWASRLVFCLAQHMLRPVEIRWIERGLGLLFVDLLDVGSPVVDVVQ
jgi:hypothetical protein